MPDELQVDDTSNRAAPASMPQGQSGDWILTGIFALAIGTIAVFSFLTWWAPGGGDQGGEELPALREVGLALKVYETDYGAFPPPSNAEMVRALGSKSRSGAPYFSFPPNELSSSGEWLDAWGHPFIYEVRQAGSWRGVKVTSKGPNGRDDSGAGDDIVEER